MMHAYNLSWKLAYQINGLTPESLDPKAPSPLVDTYQIERHENALKLIDFDREFSSIFSGQVDTEGSVMSHAEFVQMFNTGNGFTSGCGVEYQDSMAVVRDFSAGSSDPITGTDYLSGILRPGRRLLNVKLRRFADGWQRDIQDGSLMSAISFATTTLTAYLDLESTGRFRLLCLTSSDLLDTSGISQKSLIDMAMMTDRFPDSLIESIIVHPRVEREFEWDDIPGCVKQHAEMSFYDGYELEDAYGIYGVDPSKGALAVVRPDGYVGIVAQLEDLSRVEEYLRRCIRTV